MEFYFTSSITSRFSPIKSGIFSNSTCWSHCEGFEVQLNFLLSNNLSSVFTYHVSFHGQSQAFLSSRQCLKGNGEPKTSLFVYTQPTGRVVSAFVSIYLYSRIQHLAIDVDDVKITNGSVWSGRNPGRLSFHIHRVTLLHWRLWALSAIILTTLIEKGKIKDKGDKTTSKPFLFFSFPLVQHVTVNL